LQVFLLQRSFAARLAGQVRYAWLCNPDRIALFGAVPLAAASADKLLLAVAELSVRLLAISEVLPLFGTPGTNGGHATNAGLLNYV
jgi:hypothetical protein